MSTSSTVISLLQNLSSELVTNQQQQQDGLSSQAGPLFANLNSHLRSNQQQAKHAKQSVQQARLVMETAHIRLQNLKFEQGHLEREIRACLEYESEYQTLPLHSVQELQQLAADSLIDPLPEDEHELMLLRLKFELQERIRFDEEKKQLGVEKQKLVKENEVKKNRLEDLEARLQEFVKSARAIQDRMVEG
ncbi:hypothetical protein T439DRAFT_326152 [Meredithblackwellia eburnea MCA 4105]